MLTLLNFSSTVNVLINVRIKCALNLGNGHLHVNLYARNTCNKIVLNFPKFLSISGPVPGHIHRAAQGIASQFIAFYSATTTRTELTQFNKILFSCVCIY